MSLVWYMYKLQIQRKFCILIVFFFAHTYILCCTHSTNLLYIVQCTVHQRIVNDVFDLYSIYRIFFTHGRIEDIEFKGLFDT